MEEKMIRLTIPAKDATEYVCIVRKIDAKHGNPLKLWHDLGEPSTLTAEQKQLFLLAANPEMTSETIVCSGGDVSFNITLSPNAFAHIEIKPVSRTASIGYTYPKAENE